MNRIPSVTNKKTQSQALRVAATVAKKPRVGEAGRATKAALRSKRSGKSAASAGIKKELSGHPFFYLSFASNTAFLGAVILRASSEAGAIRSARRRGIHPGGDVMSWALTANDMKRIPADMSNRLLSEKELYKRLPMKGAAEK